MTPAVLAYVESLHLSGRCLDVGALDVNGCPRHLFTDYTGVDLRSGPNVDVVAPAAFLPWPGASFDTVLCLEMLEHCEDPFAAVAEMGRVLRPGGRLVATVPSIGFHRHAYPRDYWRMTADGLAVLLGRVGPAEAFEDRDHSYCCAVKPVSTAGEPAERVP